MGVFDRKGFLKNLQGGRFGGYNQFGYEGNAYQNSDKSKQTTTYDTKYGNVPSQIMALMSGYDSDIAALKNKIGEMGNLTPETLAKFNFSKQGLDPKLAAEMEQLRNQIKNTSAMPQLDAASQAALAKIQADAEGKAQKSYDVERDANIARLFGSGVNRSTIALDQQGRLESGLANTMSGIAADIGGKELSLRTELGAATLARLQAALGGLENQAALAEQYAGINAQQEGNQAGLQLEQQKMMLDNRLQMLMAQRDAAGMGLDRAQFLSQFVQPTSQTTTQQGMQQGQGFQAQGSSQFPMDGGQVPHNVNGAGFAGTGSWGGGFDRNTFLRMLQGYPMPPGFQQPGSPWGNSYRGWFK
jgi:hypothetical protein